MYPPLNDYEIVKLPERYSDSQSVTFENELIICGGYNNNKCYSYHTIKKEYKYICSYPGDISFDGHFVTKFMTNSQTSGNELNLLSFGGIGRNTTKCTFLMKYKSVWDYPESKTDENFNMWVKCNDNQNIGKFNENLKGSRGLIGGKDNNLLFITHPPHNIKIVDLKTMTTIQDSKIAQKDYSFSFHFFTYLTINNIKVQDQFILICDEGILFIEYNEKTNKFFYESIGECHNLNIPFSSFVSFYDCIFLFGGRNVTDQGKGSCVYKWSMKNHSWKKCKFKIPLDLYSSSAILNDRATQIHIIGAESDYDKNLHCIIDLSVIHKTIELAEIAELYECIGLQDEQMRMSHGTPFPPHMKRRRIQYTTETSPEKCEYKKEELKKLETKLKKFDDKMKIYEMNWDDIWSIDGKFSKMEKKISRQMQDISLNIDTSIQRRQFLKILFAYISQSALEDTSQSLNEISERKKIVKSEIDTVCSQKIKLKAEIDTLLVTYINCIVQHNKLCSTKRDIIYEENKLNEKLKTLNESIQSELVLLNRFDDLSGNLNLLLEQNKNWMKDEWNKLERRFIEWKPLDIAIFIGHNLRFTKSEMNECKENAEKKKIGGSQLLNKEIQEWMDMFNFMKISAITVRNSFHKILITYSTEHIPKNFLCPISNAIMNDPVKALDGRTYDRQSITNNYRMLPNCSSVLNDGKLELFANFTLKEKIQSFLNGAK
ncbi:hypothetical protein RFI_16454 [Reticulomyxa filosa]|uniref:U-box domain-containing protein n=1 Tax=Reticulomyxa filosa TaxID=46433 RepID=X6N4C3_RETFI|nr:hypothetical protein RFI_16454 [Reticulomyxa filosa]|eukprot:ETO20763.1 hypothetical protein RFI_16454 [Reticulomyxa filosa]